MLEIFIISGEEYELACIEATEIVDSVLVESVKFVENAQQYPDSTIRSESEHFAITCDVNGLDLIKSPTIESMSGISFDDNISVPDVDLLDVNMFYCSNNSNNCNNVIDHESSSQPSINEASSVDMKKTDRIERKFERLSSQLDIDFEQNDEQYDDEFDKALSILNSDEVNNLQSDFSKISWDESISATTGDMGLSTPDNDIQELPKGD